MHVHYTRTIFLTGYATADLSADKNTHGLSTVQGAIQIDKERLIINEYYYLENSPKKARALIG